MIPRRFFICEMFVLKIRHDLCFPAVALPEPERNDAMRKQVTQTLDIIDGETLMDLRLPPTRFCVDTLLPQGLCILGGAPKIGKSWLVLDLCVRVAKGEPIWNLPTKQGTTLYLCLEDPLRRVQERLNRITEEAPPNAFFATSSGTLADGLDKQLRRFVTEHPDTVLVVVDTFQIIRDNTADPTYASDYGEMRKLKALADELDITLLLVHHLRKQGDSDPLNKLSGTTGISGGVDAAFVLDKSKRSATGATLISTGRDILYREMELEFSKQTCRWDIRSDSFTDPILTLPEEMQKLVAFMQEQGSFRGSNQAFADLYNCATGQAVSSKSLKQMMNRWRFPLEEQGIRFESKRSNGQRLVEVFCASTSDASDGKDTETLGGEICVPTVPCDPAGT